MKPNQRIGDYEILEELGSGGMGRVFRVRNVISERIEAMKVLLPDLAGRPDLAARFLREIKVLAGLSHPNIAALQTALTADNQLVMVMEFVAGQSLAQRIALGPIPAREALAYIDQALDALGYAHLQQVVHRDVKPANMMLTPQGIVKLTDFGIAHARDSQTLTMAGTTTGSLSYMSPEQVSGEETDARSDLYSLGISLYEMVTGQRPFESKSDFALMNAHLKEVPRPPIALQPALAPELNACILKAIEKSPADRFQTAAEFRAALGRRPSAAAAAAAARDTTRLALPAPAMTLPQAATPASMMAGPPAAPASDHARTVLDTRTPSAPLLQARTGRTPSSVPIPPAAPKWGRPVVYAVLGGVVAIAVLAFTGNYLRWAEGGQNEPADGSTGSTLDSSRGGGKAPGTSGQGAEPTPPVVDPLPPDGTNRGPAVVGTPPIQGSGSKSAGMEKGAGEAGAGLLAEKPTSGQPAREGGARAAIGAGIGAKPRGGAGGGTVGQPEPPGPAGPGPVPPPAADAGTAPSKVQDTAELDQLEQEVVQLSARAGSVNATLDRMQDAQARQGVGLRGDMAARQQSMNLNLTRAEEAVNNRDIARARRFKGQAESDLEVLEKFLGR